MDDDRGLDHCVDTDGILALDNGFGAGFVGEINVRGLIRTFYIFVN